MQEIPDRLTLIRAKIVTVSLTMTVFNQYGISLTQNLLIKGNCLTRTCGPIEVIKAIF